jgi:hypothetical protein
MRYSVYDYTRRAYDYYEAPGPSGTHATSPQLPPTPPRGIGSEGTAPDRASWKLPGGARKVGSGENPQGRIASLSGADLTSDPMRLTALAAIAYVAWRMFR